MVSSLFLLAVLDYIILSPSPDITRTAIALAVTLAVLSFIGVTWRRNTTSEKESGAHPPR